MGYLMTAGEWIAEFGISRGYAYKLIREMNEKLQKEGYIAISGKIPRAYVEKQFFGFRAKEEHDQKR